MRSRPVRCLAAAALLVLPFAARADQLAAGDIVVSNAGTYLARETGTIPAPGTAAGTANGIDRWVFLGAAPICMTMGVRFGFEYHLAQPRPDAGRTLQVMNDHPPMHLPDGRVVAHEQYRFPSAPRRQHRRLPVRPRLRAGARHLDVLAGAGRANAGAAEL